MKKRSEYLITGIIVLAIFIIVFFVKNIYPFGSNSLIWGDMHDQITAFYYHFYDSIKGNSSLLIDFTTSGGINFIGILAYYILSPFSLVILLFPRSDIYLAISIIIALKVLAASLTCLYFLKTYFKKNSIWLNIFLAIIYAFCGYSLSMYQITPWMDVVYLFPLLMIGLKKVLDLEKPYMYLIILTLSLITSFYISIMVVIFIFFASLIYLFSFKEKEERKKAVVALGINTFICLLLSLFVIVPSYAQISISSRITSNFNNLLNSKTGPIIDKSSLFMFGGLMYSLIIFYFIKIKKNKRNVAWFIATLLILLIPLFIEPINKLWHFGSYACFPYRVGFIPAFILIIGSAYSLSKIDTKSVSITKFKKIIISITSIISAFAIVFLAYRFYDSFQNGIYKLTISRDIMLVIMLLICTLIATINCLVILLYYKKIDRLSIIMIGLITITHITCNSMLYMGIDSKQDYLMNEYEDLLEIEKNYNESDIYRVKILNDDYIMNSSMVMKYNSLDHFTSLTDGNNQNVLKKLGYSSFWTKTYSKGGTIFTDSLLANKYLMSREKINDNNYIYINKFGNEYFYETNFDLPYGYFINKNVTVLDKTNSFEAQNSIYNSITDDESIFDIVDDFELSNIEKSVAKDNEKTKFEIIDKDKYSYLESNLKVNGKKRIYLEILNSIYYLDNMDIYKEFNIYINDELYLDHAIYEENNGVIDLGTYSNCDINIKIELRHDVELQNITLGIMDLNKFDNFLKTNKSNVSYQFKNNKININVKSDKEQTLFIPITYNTGYSATNNGKSVEIEKVFDNYIGIPINEGENNIKICFIPDKLIETTIISVIVLIGTIIIFKFGIYDKIINGKIMQSIAYNIYLFIYIAAIFIMYFIMTLCFILSYFIKF